MNLFTIGDSTMKFNSCFTYPQTGWGQALNIFLKSQDIHVYDYAENGRSTKSFIDEGRFDFVLNKMNKGDFLIISFGHNDEKIQDPKRYTTPYGTYTDNLRYMANEFISRGGNVVFSTSITRHKFENGVCINTHGDYPAAMLKLAKDMNITCIDLNKLTMDHYTLVGEEQSKKYHMIFEANSYPNYKEAKDDHSHLVGLGANMVASIFVKALYETNDPLKNLFLDPGVPEEVDYQALKDWP